VGDADVAGGLPVRVRSFPGTTSDQVELAFGQMKVRQHAGHLRLRGLAEATGEWTLHAICNNLRKLGNQRVATAAMA